METYQIKLDQFEGPFDLLLFFIERDELNIYDIPIARITDDFLDYLHQMDMLNIELASEFILVASSLMRIKAKMLLPRKELNEEGEEVDPRQELVERLLEYKRYKEVSEQLGSLEVERALKVSRGNLQKELNSISDIHASESELHSLSLYKLMTAFQKVLDKMHDRENKVVHQVVQPPYTIEQEKHFILNSVIGGSNIPFEQIFSKAENRIHAVFTFLAMLELIQLNLLSIQIGEGINNFWLSAE